MENSDNKDFDYSVVVFMQLVSVFLSILTFRFQMLGYHFAMDAFFYLIYMLPKIIFSINSQTKTFKD